MIEPTLFRDEKIIHDLIRQDAVDLLPERNRLTVTAGLLFVLTLVGPPEAEVRGVASDEVVGQAAADFEVLRVSDDAPVRLSAYEGEVVLLNVWATWCAPCLRELPELNRLQEEYAEDGLTVVTLSDESPATLRDFNREMPLETVNVYLPDAQETMPDVFREGLMIRPTTYLIDREGTVRDVFNGARDYDFFEQAVRQYL